MLPSDLETSLSRWADFPLLSWGGGTRGGRLQLTGGKRFHRRSSSAAGRRYSGRRTGDRLPVFPKILVATTIFFYLNAAVCPDYDSGGPEKSRSADTSRAAGRFFLPSAVQHM